MATAIQSALEPQSLEPSLDALPGWSVVERLLFRFVFSYFLLYSLPQGGTVNLIDVIPGASFITKPCITMWHAVVSWVAVHVFHLSGPVPVYPAQNGSGDTTLDYIQIFCYVGLAAAAAVVWSLLY